jgi:hypothetical protein
MLIGHLRQPAIAEERAFDALKAGTCCAQTQALKGHALSGQPGRTDVGPGWLQLGVRNGRMRSPLFKK